MKYMRLLIIFFVAICLTSCSPSRQSIHYGKDLCANCKMMIVDPKFSAKLTTQKGRTYFFDALNCMINFNKTLKDPNTTSMYISNYDQALSVVPVKDGFYVQAKDLHSPMGFDVVAFSTKSDAQHFQKLKQGELLDWVEVSQRAEK